MLSAYGIDVGGTFTATCGCDDDTVALHVHEMASTPEQPGPGHYRRPSLVLDIKPGGSA